MVNNKAPVMVPLKNATLLGLSHWSTMEVEIKKRPELKITGEQNWCTHQSEF